MNKKRLSFALLLILVVIVCAFLLWPAPEEKESLLSEDASVQQSDVETGSQEEDTEPDDYDSMLQEGINGTYAHYYKDKNKTVFVFFDEVHGMYIQEVVEMTNGVPIKSAGNYSLHEDEGLIVIDGVKKSFERKGENLLIDGVLYERTQGILLTLY